jgi:flagellar biosynthesis/type III secretory pathway ATPase
VSSPDQLEAARKVREALALYQNSEDLIQLGAYVSGSNPRLDVSIRARDGIMNFLRQRPHEKSALNETLGGLKQLAAAL